MTLIEKTAYPRFTDSLFSNEMQTYFVPNQEEMDFVNNYSRSDVARLTLLILLKAYQFLGRCISIEQVPIVLTEYLSEHCDIKVSYSNLLDFQSEKTLYRYRQAIRNFMGLKVWSNQSKELIEEKVSKASYTMSDPADLINVAVEALSDNHFELPAFGTIDRLVRQIRNQIYQSIFKQIAAQLDHLQKAVLDDLLAVDKNTRLSDFTRIKQVPHKATLVQMRLWSQRLKWLNTIIEFPKQLGEISYTKVREFAAQTKQLELGDIKDIGQNDKRYTLLLCLLHNAQTTTRDELVNMYLKRIRKTHNRAREHLVLLREQYRKVEEDLMGVFNQVLKQANEIAEDATLGKDVKKILDNNGGTEKLLKQYEILSAFHRNNYLPLLWGKHKAHRRALFNLLDLLDIGSTTEDDSLLKALDLIKEHQHLRKEYIESNIELDFLSYRWKNFVEHLENGGVLLKRKAFEVCIISLIADAFRCGDLYVKGSEQFSDFRKQLLDWDDCTKYLSTYCKGVGLANTSEIFIQTLKEKLSTTITQADKMFPSIDCFTIDQHGKAHLKRIAGQNKPRGFKEFQQKLRKQMPERHLLDMLKNIEHWTGFTKHFSPPSGADNKMNDALQSYLFTIFDYGCNLGPSQTAKHTPSGISLRTIKRINEEIINQYAKMDIINRWGSGKTAIADGTHIPLIKNNLLGEQHIRYGAYGGIAYHHISDTYVALFCNFIACGVWEAVYILDGLLKNTSHLQPDTVHADTQGQNEPVFGLSYLLGIKLMPRIRNWNKLNFYKADDNQVCKHIESLFTDTIDWKLLQTHWKDLMQVVISIQQGKVLPSMILRKLGTDSRKNKLYKAFRELGRVIRTIFLLEYVSSQKMQRTISSQTNKIESFHAFHDWISFGGTTITTGDPIEQQKRNQYIDLVANAVMLHNVIDLTKVVKGIKREDEDFKMEYLKYLSPYLTGHIKRFGQYVLDLDDLPEPLQMEDIKLE